MIYDIESLSKSELLRLLIDIQSRFNVDAIDANQMQSELNRIEALKKQEQIAKDIANSGYSPEELLEVLRNMVTDAPIAIPQDHKMVENERKRTMHTAEKSTKKADVQAIVNRNIQREKDVFDSKLKALMDKYNNKKK